jgi:hypothetical protein
MATTSKRVDYRILAGVLFMISAAGLAFVNITIAISIFVVGAVLFASGANSTRKARTP